jgi:hypothetical protein
LRRQVYLDEIATGLTVEALAAPIERAQDATAVDRLRTAAATANELRGLGEALLDRYVQAARADGRSWTEIGTALAVSKQAAHERFAAAPLAWPPNFNQQAREVVARAQSEARGFGHRYLGTEHLLLALTADPGIAGAALARFGASESAVRRSIEQTIGRGQSSEVATLGVTSRTKRVFEEAIKEAKRVSGQRCADPVHVLLALTSSKGVAGEILAAHAGGEEAVREQLATLLERKAPETAAKLRVPPRRRGRRRRRA